MYSYYCSAGFSIAFPLFIYYHLVVAVSGLDYSRVEQKRTSTKTLQWSEGKHGLGIAVYRVA